MGTFNGFSPEALRFLRDLAKHNDRAWFAPRKELYQKELLEPLQALVADATSALHKAKIPLGGDPKRSVFRIYRDIRFSPDKSPYKTNVGAILSNEHANDSRGGLYIHIQPQESCLAAGFHELDKALLQRWREAMARDPKAFEKLARALESERLTLSEDENGLKRMPRGFEAFASHTIARYFKLRSFIVSENLSDDDVMHARLIDRIVDLGKRAKALFTYGAAV
jgi:uncharacterized protein (TIGR02453 family)